jgi:hypothetical protein
MAEKAIWDSAIKGEDIFHRKKENIQTINAITDDICLTFYFLFVLVSLVFK